MYYFTFFMFKNQPLKFLFNYFEHFYTQPFKARSKYKIKKIKSAISGFILADLFFQSSIHYLCKYKI